MKRTYLFALPLLAAGTIAITGCNSNSASSSSATAPSPAAANPPCVLKITAQSSDIYLDVANVSTRACNVVVAAASAAQSSASITKITALPAGLAESCTYTTKNGRQISVYADSTDPVAKEASARVCKDNGR